MRTGKFLVLLASAVFVQVVCAFQARSGENGGNDERPRYAPDRIIVKFKQTVSKNRGAAVHAAKGAGGTRRLVPDSGTVNVQRDMQAHGLDRIEVVILPAGADVLQWVKKYSDDPDVEYAEPDYLCTIYMTPNDPYFLTSGSWGQSYRDMWALEKISAPRAWDVNMGNSGIVVAVIDTGVDYNHPDVASNIWTNPREIAGNGIDDDRNGYVDDVRGWDFSGDDNDPMDDHGHGTHVSGTIAAVGNNGIGIVGIAMNCKIMPVKGLAANGSGWSSDLSTGIIYAANHGARLSNNSWGGPWSQTVADAVSFSDTHRCVVVAAAGNSFGIDAAQNTPGGAPQAVTVASTDTNDVRSDYSDIGAVVDVSAPGGNSAFTSSTKEYSNILSLRANGTGSDSYAVGGQYYRMRGTSMACPHASGVLALIASKNPTWTNAQIVAQLKNTTDDIDGLNPGFPGYLGTGRINAERALADVQKPYMYSTAYAVNDTTGNNNGYPDRGEQVRMTVTIKNSGLDATSVQAVLRTTDPYTTISTSTVSLGNILNGQSVTNTTIPFVYTVATNAPPDHQANFTVDLTSNGYTKTIRLPTIPVGPKIVFTSMAVNDSAGNGNGVADPGETVDLVVTLTNQWGAATSVAGVLSSSDSSATVVSANGTFGTIGNNLTGSNSGTPFRVSISPTATVGSAVKLNLSVTAAWSYLKGLRFDLGIGITPWSRDAAVNNPISTAADVQGSAMFSGGPKITGDGAGGGIVVWHDKRNGADLDIYGRRVSSGGVFPGEIPLCVMAGNQGNPQVTTDGVGGAIMVWEDYRGGTTSDIYAQRLNGNGVVQWSANGVVISSAGNNQLAPQVVSDGVGGAIVTWQDYRSGSHYDIYVQRINANGTVQWVANGVPVCSAANNQIVPKMVSDDASGAMIVWQDLRNGSTYDLYVQRINGSGTVQWAADGVLISNGAGNDIDQNVIQDGSGGAIIAWEGSAGILAQKINSAGTAQWAANGVTICSAVIAQKRPLLATDGAGGAFIVWSDGNHVIAINDMDVYAQRVNSDGVVQWAANGIVINAFQGVQSPGQVISDGVGGAIIVWQDLYVTAPLLMDDLYAQRIDGAGNAQWNVPGNLAVSFLPTSWQGNCNAVGDGAGNAIVVWNDSRSDLSTHDIYAQRILSNGSLGSQPSAPAAPSGLSATAVSPSQINLAWTDNSSDETGYKLERSTDGTNFTEIAVLEANATSFSNTGLSPSTTYTYRVRSYYSDVASTYSNVVSATTQTNRGPGTPAQPSGQVSGLVAGPWYGYSALATDPDGHQVQYTFDWGDGTTYTTAVFNSGSSVTAWKSWTSPGTYSVRVRATDVYGASSGWSAGLAVTVTNPVPAAPSSLAATAISVSQINLKWTDNSNNEAGFLIERSTNNVSFTQIATMSANFNTYCDYNLSRTTTYYYRVRAYNSAGNSAYTGTANARTMSSSSLIINISTRTYVSTGSNAPVGGFIISGTEPKTVLIRGWGPTLVDYGLTGVLANPTLNLYYGSTIVARNDNWQTNDPLMLYPVTWKATGSEIQALGKQPVGTNNQYESVLLVTLQPGLYTAKVSGVSNGVGIGMISVDEVPDYTSSSRLINISTRTYVSTGSNAPVGGFIITGTEPKKVLIRGWGPTLVDYGLTGVLANPTLNLYSGSTIVARNDNWQTNDPLQINPPVLWKGTASDIQAIGRQPAGTKNQYESVLLVTLQPGLYTAKVSGVSNGVGIGMISVDEIND